MARTRHYRSRQLVRSQVAKAVAAYDAAASGEMPLNLVLHVHWQWTRFAQNRRDAITSLLENQRHWLAHRRAPFVSIAVRENSFGTAVGEHVHQIVHVPPALQEGFIAHTKQFLAAGKPKRKALVCGPVYSRGILAYLCKGATAEGRALILNWLPTEQEREAFMSVIASKPYQGVIYGKRLLIARALCSKAISDRKAPSLAAA